MTEWLFLITGYVTVGFFIALLARFDFPGFPSDGPSKPEPMLLYGWLLLILFWPFFLILIIGYLMTKVKI